MAIVSVLFIVVTTLQAVKTQPKRKSCSIVAYDSGVARYGEVVGYYMPKSHSEHEFLAYLLAYLLALTCPKMPQARVW